jgi:hypothetical protein
VPLALSDFQLLLVISARPLAQTTPRTRVPPICDLRVVPVPGLAPAATRGFQGCAVCRIVVRALVSRELRKENLFAARRVF